MGLMSVLAYSQLSKNNLPSQYYNNLGYDDFKKGQYGQLKPGYISSSTPLHSGYGDALYSKSSRRVVTRRNPKVGNTYGTRPGLYIYNDPKVAQQQQQQAYQQQLQATAARTQADIAKQLQIVQSEKSAVSKMMSEYSAQLTAEADRRKKAEEAARVAAATSAANQARQGQTTNLQIQPASSTPKTAGTQPFKRRQLQFNPQTYGAVASMKSGTLNI